MTTNWYAGEQIIHQHHTQQDVLSRRAVPRIPRNHWWTKRASRPRPRVVRFATAFTH